MRPRLALIGLIALLLAGGIRAEPLTVFAAASLTDALEELAMRWRERGHTAPRLSFAASSTLARQIEAGAPAAIFASANVPWMDHLEREGLLVAGSRRQPIGNRLVLVAPADGRIRELDPATTPIISRLRDGERLAVGDPAHVPAGLYAREALERLGQWRPLADRLARTDHVRAALALVARGEVPLAVVYATDARLTPRVRVVGRFPEPSHAPIVYPFARVAAGDAPSARDLFDFLTGPEAARVYRRHGFETR